jgi:hypothetical protein
MRWMIPAFVGGAIALTLTGCLAEPDGYRYAVPVGAGGNYAPAQPNYVPRPNYAPPPVARNSRDLPSQPLRSEGEYLEDPEAESSEFPEEIWAYDEADAAQKCKAIASNYAKQSGTVVSVVGRPQQKTRTPSQSGAYKFVCTIRVEH